MKFHKIHIDGSEKSLTPVLLVFCLSEFHKLGRLCIEKCTVCHLDRSGSTLLHPELPDPGLVAADGVAGGGVAAVHEGDQAAALLRHLRTHLPLLPPAPASSRH